jgi:bifunctional oligoribonuclease and PAP phosphatase NrnA
MSENDNRSVMLPRVLEALHAHQSFLLTSHEYVDGDGTGSEVALAAGLEAIGKRVRVVNNEPLSPRYAFLDPNGRCATYDSETFPSILAASEVVVVLDNNAWSRLKHLEAPLRAVDRPVICIDHHRWTQPFSDLHLVNVDAASTGEIVFDILRELGVAMTQEIATAIYTTLCTDTGWFKFSNTTRRTFEICAELMPYGIDPEQINAEVNYKDSVDLKRLLARVLDGMQVECGGRFAWAAVSRAMRAGVSVDLQETDSFIDHLRNIDGVLMTAVIKELRSGGVKVSLRSRGAASALAVARALGGGGHHHAAGTTLKTSLERAIDLVRAEVKKQMPEA